MRFENMKNTIIFALAFISGCSTDKEQIEVSLPYADSCKDTMVKVEKTFNQLNSLNNERKYSFEYKSFDVKAFANPELQGVISLKYSGIAKPVTEGWATPKEYLTAVANGIHAECMQDSRTVLDSPVDTDYLKHVLRGKKNPVVKIVDDNLVIFYNSGTYQLSE